FVSSLHQPDVDDTIRLTATAVVSTCWLAAAILALASDRDGLMWKLLLAYVFASWLPSLSTIRDPVLWTIGDTLANPVQGFLFVLIALTFPTGRLRDRVDRLFLAAVFVQTVITGLGPEMTYDPGFPCPSICIRNLLYVWPDDAMNSLFLTI